MYIMCHMEANFRCHCSARIHSLSARAETVGETQPPR